MALSLIKSGGVAASGMPTTGVIQIQRTLFTGTSLISAENVTVLQILDTS